MSDITTGHVVCESARARELLKEAAAVELLIAEGAYPQGVSARVVTKDGERVTLALKACSFACDAEIGAGHLAMVLTDDSEVTWCRPMRADDRIVSWERNAGPLQAGPTHGAA